MNEKSNINLTFRNSNFESWNEWLKFGNDCVNDLTLAKGHYKDDNFLWLKW